MKAFLKNIFTWLGLSILMMIFWIAGLMAGNALIPSELMNMANDQSGNGEIVLFVVSMLNSGVILYYIRNSKIGGWRLVFFIFIIAFGIMYFMSQIETLWFNESVKFPVRGVFALVLGGAIGTSLFSIVATWLTGNFKRYGTPVQLVNVSSYSLRNIIILSAAVWPVLYWTAGYLIAWRFEEIRFYYSGTYSEDPFLMMATEYLTSTLYFFQIFRGFLWVLIGILIVRSIDGTPFKKAIITGLLLSILGSSQLLLSNPFMPDMVRMGHLLETSTSTFLWGFIIGLTLEYSSSSYSENPKLSPTL